MAQKKPPVLPPAGVDYNLLAEIEAEAGRFGLRVTSRKRTPEHNRRVGGSPRSLHLSGNAIDLAGPPEKMRAFADHARKKYGSRLAELLYGDKDHRDHVHVGVRPGARQMPSLLPPPKEEEPQPKEFDPTDTILGTAISGGDLGTSMALGMALHDNPMAGMEIPSLVPPMPQQAAAGPAQRMLARLKGQDEPQGPGPAQRMLAQLKGKTAQAAPVPPEMEPGLPEPLPVEAAGEPLLAQAETVPDTASPDDVPIPDVEPRLGGLFEPGARLAQSALSPTREEVLKRRSDPLRILGTQPGQRPHPLEQKLGEAAGFFRHSPELLGRFEGAPGFLQGANALVMLLNRPNDLKNAFINGYMAHRGQHPPQTTPDLESQWQVTLGALRAGAQAAGDNWSNPHLVPLKDLWGRVAPFLKRTPSPIPTGTGIKRGATASALGIYSGLESVLRGAGMTQAADEMRAAIGRLNESQRKTLGESFIPLDKVADFVTDLSSDPLKVVGAGGSLGAAYLRRSPAGQALTRAVNLGTTAQGVRAAGRQVPKVAPLANWLAGHLEREHVRRGTKPLFDQAKIATAQGIDKVAGNVKAIHTVAEAAGKHLGKGMDEAFDRLLWEYVDAGPGGLFKQSKREVLADAAKAGFPPEWVARLKALGDEAVRNEDEFGRLLTKYRILDPAAREALRGQHLRYIYKNRALDPEDIQEILHRFRKAGTVDTSVAKQRIGPEWDRDADEKLELVRSGIKSLGTGGQKEAHASATAELFDRISRDSRFAMRDPAAPADIRLLKEKDRGLFLPAKRTVNGKGVEDLVAIGDEVKFGSVAGRVEEIQYAGDGSIATLRIGATDYTPEEILHAPGGLVKTGGPVRAVHGDKLPPGVMDSALRVREKEAVREIARRRATEAELEIKALRKQIEETKRTPGALLGGLRREDIIQAAEEDIRRNRALQRYYKRAITKGDIPVRNIPDIDAEIVGLRGQIAAAKDRKKQLELQRRIDDLHIEKEASIAHFQAEARKAQAAAASELPIPDGWVKVEGARWGALDQHFIPKGLKDLIEDRYGNRGWENDAVIKAAARATGYIKLIKTAYNPATRVTNVLGNTILAETALQLQGLNPALLARYLPQAVREVSRGEGPLLSELRQFSTAFHETSDFVSIVDDAASGLGDILPKTAWGRVKGVIDRPGKGYQRDERIFKVALYGAFRHGAKGMDAERAAALTQRYLFDYSDVPQFISILRKYGIMPFVTFPYKAADVVMETLAHKPHLINRWNILQGHAWAAVDEAQGQYPDIPDYAKGKPMIPLLKDEKGRWSFLDLSRQLPWGFAFQGEQFNVPGILGNSFMFGFPTGALVKSGLPGGIGGDGFNRNPALGMREELRPGMTPGERERVKWGNTLQTYLPPLFAPDAGSLPGIGGLVPDQFKDTPMSLSADRLRRGLSGLAATRQQFSPDQSAWAAVAQSIFGLATYLPEGPQYAGNREEYASRLRDEVAPILRQSVQDAKRVFDAASEGKAPLTPYPQVQKIGDMDRLLSMISAAEGELRKVAQDGTLAPAARRRKLTDLLGYIFSAAKRARELAPAERSRLQGLAGGP